jgi:hypothetical protein
VFGPAEAAAAAARAIDEARASVRAVKMSIVLTGDRFHGTVPPPPWPAPPELVKAIEKMEIVRDGFEVFARRVPQARWPKQFDAKLAIRGKVGPALIATGDRLYYELGRFEESAARAKQTGNTLASLLRVFPDPRKLLLGSVPTWMLLAGGWLAWRNRHRLGRLLSAR